MSIRKGLSLIGPPTAGKSSLGEILQQTLPLGLLDTDAYIEENIGPIGEIRSRGDQYLIDLEEKIIKDINLEKALLATSGSVVYASNEVIEKMRKESIVIYLETSQETIVERLARPENSGRAILGDGSIEEILQERAPLYREWAEETVVCDGRSLYSIADAIIRVWLEKSRR